MVFVLASCADPDERASAFIDEGESVDTRQVDAEDMDIDVKRNSDFFSNKDNELDSSHAGGNIPSPIIPSPRGSCPVLKTGTVNVMGHQVMLWVGQRRDDVKGMVYFYWHSTGAGPDEAKRVLGPAIDEIVASGGVVASFTGRPPNMPILQGNTGNGVWYVQDFKIADEVLACAVQQLNIDKRRIYAGGTSAGGLQTGVMAINRSNYLAAAMTNSGGILEPLVQTGTCPLKWTHPEWVPAMISVHGGIEDWWLGMEFGEATRDITAISSLLQAFRLISVTGSSPDAQDVPVQFLVRRQIDGFCGGSCSWSWRESWQRGRGWDYLLAQSVGQDSPSLRRRNSTRRLKTYVLSGMS
jgi:hypothetical protein